MRSPRACIGASCPKRSFGAARRTCLAFLALVLCVRGAAAGQVLTLRDAVSRALEHAPRARIARLETERAAEALSVSESAYWPVLGVTSQAGWSNRLDETLEAVDGRGRVREYGFSSLGSREGWFNVFVRQLLFDLGRWRLVRQARIEAEAAQIGEAKRRETVALEVLARYVDVLRLERLVKLDRENMSAAEWLDEQAEHLLAAGRCLASQREETRLFLERARLDGALHQGELASARAALVRAVGDPGLAPDSLVPAEESLPAAGPNPNLDSIIDAVENSPEARILAARQRAEELRVSAARAERYPKAAIVAGYSHYGAKRYDAYSDEVRIGVDFELPLFDGFRTRHLVAQALKDAQIARLRYRSLVEEKRARARDLARRLAAAHRQAELAQRQARLAEERVRLADLQLRSATGSLDAALAARSERVRDAQAAIDARYDTIRLWARLRHETGQLASAILDGDPGEERKTSRESG